MATAQAKLRKTRPRKIWEWLTWTPTPLIGIDEVGRGCLAGPVYAAAVILDTQWPYKLYADSKILSAERREELSLHIHAHHWTGIGFATAQEIDEINILNASFLAMNRAVVKLTKQLSDCPEHDFEWLEGSGQSADRSADRELKHAHVIVDGHMKIRGMNARFVQTPIIAGDLRVAPVSAASIIAKVARDQFMKDLKGQFPQYGFESHKGYGTKEHQAALKAHGPCEFHRRSFRGISSDELERVEIKF